MLYLIVGLFIGANIGVLAAGLCRVSGKTSEDLS
jgi:hypothetical protein